MGGAIFFGGRGKVTISRGVFESDPEELALEARAKRPPDFNDNHQKDWLDCIKSRGKPRADVETGHRSATVCHLGNIARWTGRKLNWDPVKQEIVGDEEARRLMSRPQRYPYVL